MNKRRTLMLNILESKQNLLQLSNSPKKRTNQYCFEQSKLLFDLKRTQHLLLKVIKQSQGTHKKSIDSLKAAKKNYKSTVQRLIAENKRLKNALRKLGQPQDQQLHISHNRDQISSYQPSVSEASCCKQQLFGKVYECPKYLQKFFIRPARCRQVSGGQNRQAVGMALGLFKFIALAKDSSITEPVLSLIEHENVHFDVFAEQSVPERYRYLYDNTIIKSVLLCYLKQLAEVSSEAQFFQLISDNQVFEFISVLFLKTICLDEEGEQSLLAFDDEIQINEMINTVGSLFEMRVLGDLEGFFKLQKGAASWSVLLTDEHVLIFEVQQMLGTEVIKEEEEDGYFQ